MSNVEYISTEQFAVMSPEQVGQFRDSISSREIKFREAQEVIKHGCDHFAELWRISPVYTRPNGSVDVAQMATDFGISRPRLYEWVKRTHPEVLNIKSRSPIVVRDRAA